MHDCVCAIKAYCIIRMMYKLFAGILFHVFTHKAVSSFLQNSEVFIIPTFQVIFYMLYFNNIVRARRTIRKRLGSTLKNVF